jgi:hypothetical protein
MIWVRKTGMTLNSTMTLYGISTIDDALRFIFSFARAILKLFKTHDLYAFVSKDQRPTISSWAHHYEGRSFFTPLFLSRRFDGVRLFI